MITEAVQTEPVQTRTRYECPQCCEAHDYERDARYCCSIGITKTFICPGCHQEHEHESKAIACCQEAPDNVIRDVLELHGQARLLA
jgi:hypothetical protein